eukprot:gb/GECH01012691.1/.p1 GENE.gb/GECH01012691.1/~~gb/GECH01012691.1/.p1  ORF type:complete len:341 (+),score=65.64 gb/GECH01012691.1/:1-1023(+)
MRASTQITRPNLTIGRQFINNSNIQTSTSSLTKFRSIQQQRGVHNRKDFLLDKNGKLKPKIYFSDQEILAKCNRSGELPDTYIPVMEPEIKVTPARQFLNVLYKQFKERYNRHRNLVWYNLIYPLVGAGAWVAPSATVVGHVMLNENASVWYNAVIRGDKGFVSISAFSNVQDGAVITSDDAEDDSGFEAKMEVGPYSVIGHNARLHSCKIGYGSLVGIGATVLEGAIVEDGAMVAAGSVVPPGRIVPAGELWAGNPAQFMRKLSPNEIKNIKSDAIDYVNVARKHASEFTMYSPAYREVEKMAKTVEENLPQERDPLEEAEIEAHEAHKRQVGGSEHFF